MKINNTVTAVALILCTVILKEVLSLYSAFSILQISLAAHNYSLESFRTSWGILWVHVDIRFRINTPYEFYLKTWEESLCYADQD